MVKIEPADRLGITVDFGNEHMPKKGIVVHYAGPRWVHYKNHASCRRTWKMWHNDHIENRGWKGIGYNWGVCPHGIVLTGRGLRQQGAHAGYRANRDHQGVVFMIGGIQRPTVEQLRGFRELRSFLMAEGVGSMVTPHSRWLPRPCPGNHLRDRIRRGDWEPRGDDPSSSGSSGGMVSVRSIRSQKEIVNAAGFEPRLALSDEWDSDTDRGVRWIQETIGTPKRGVDALWGARTEERYVQWARRNPDLVPPSLRGTKGIPRNDETGWRSSPTAENPIWVENGVTFTETGRQIWDIINHYPGDKSGLYITSSYRKNDVTSHHGEKGICIDPPSGAVDVGFSYGAGGSKERAESLAWWLDQNYDLLLELIFATEAGGYFVKDRERVPRYGTHEHRKHIHIATSLDLAKELKRRIGIHR